MAEPQAAPAAGATPQAPKKRGGDLLKAALQSLPWAPKVRAFWAFEVGNPLLKAVSCTVKGRSFRVEKLIARPLTTSIRESFAAVLGELAGDAAASKRARVAVSRNLVTLRNLELPSTQPQELESMLELQIAKQSPYKREEIVCDWQTGPHPRSGFSNVLLAVAHRFPIMDYVEPLTEAGYDIESAGLVSSGLGAFAPKGSGPVILLEVAAYYTEFQILSNQKLLFSRTILVGADRLSGDDPDSLDKLVTEVKRSLEIFQNEQTVTSLPSEALLMGAAQFLEPVRARLTEELALNVKLARPLSQVFEFSRAALESLKSLEAKESFYGLLGGFVLPASRHFNLMPSELKMQKALEERTRELARLGVLVASFVMAVSGLLLEQVYKEKAVLRKLTARVEQTAGEAEEVEKMRHVLDVVRHRASPDGSALAFLDTLHRVTHPDLYYKTVAFQDSESMSLRGYAKQMSSVLEFVTSLEKGGPFRDVETKYATRRKIRDEELVEFEIIGRFG